MEDAREVEKLAAGQETEGDKSLTVDTNVINKSTIFPLQKSYKWWIKVIIFSLFVLAGQTVATLLGRLYYDKGGKSKWMGALVQPGGFLVLASSYISVGALLAVDSMMYSIGYKYLPVSTYSLLSATQLAFNAFFSFFINSLKLTPYIVNSLFLLTISSIVLVFQVDDSTHESTYQVSKGQYAIGFICTIGASAGHGLMLSLTQLYFRKVVRKRTFKAVLDMIIYPSLISTCAILVGLFVSGEWKGLSKEMEEYKMGNVSYLMTLIWAAVSWQVFSLGSIGLIFQVSSVFSNVISALCLPVVPVLAVFFFHDKMSGIKVVAIVLAFWGFVSYVYQQYLDDRNYKFQTKHTDVEAPNDSTTT
ncbi:hypothetical protein JRO89_XS06G0023300 [Xanthoceras sorbifolium]|uniref:Probable purine permease n=1 Tax=Xanthoceras sorbifolium TaxID=99658 RepID=A0ABQ8HW73_9ROSI|nr:hypothetical protein JRO89_XS06G0023300 [Xanthoceras sorbifolium]